MFNILIISILVIYYLWFIVCLSRVFYKAGIRWWYSLIPIVNLYYYCKIAGKTKCFRVPFYLFMSWFLIGIVFVLLFGGEEIYDKWLLYKEYAIGMNDFYISHGFFFYQLNEFVLLCLNMAFWVSLFISIFKVNIGLSKKFKHSVLFGIFLAILNPVFLFFLAFDKSKYNKKLK